MSKLKRRKICEEELRPEKQSKNTDQNESLHIPDASLRSRSEGSPAGDGASCWTSSALCGVENIWLKTLRVLCPQSLSQGETFPPLPPLPYLSHLSQKVDTQSEQHWCSLDEDVPPLPDLLSHFPPPPCISSALPHDRSGCPFHQSRVSECETDMNRFTAEGEAEGEVQSDTSTLNSKTELRSGSDNEASETAGVDGGLESDRVRLEHCPMCLMVFPAGFSQLECDGHLAQCLSEMNVDVVW